MIAMITQETQQAILSLYQQGSSNPADQPNP